MICRSKYGSAKNCEQKNCRLDNWTLFLKGSQSHTFVVFGTKVAKGVICRSVRTYTYMCMCVRRSICPLHCGKTADRVRMPFGIIGRTCPGMRQVVRFGDRSTGRGTFGANLGRAIVTCGDFTAYVCDSAATRPFFQITLGRLVGIVAATTPSPMHAERLRGWADRRI